MRKTHAVAIAIILILPVVASAHGSGHVMGTIDKLEDDTLTVTKTDGEVVFVRLTGDTLVFKGKNSGSREDIQAGSRVVVHYAKDKTAAEVHLPAGE